MTDAVAALTAEPAAPAAPVAAAPSATPAAPAPAAAPADPAAQAPADPAAQAPAAPSLTLPGKDATPEQWSEYYKAIGAPSSADAYDLPVPDGDDGAFAKQAAAWMAENGVLPHQAKGLASKWNEFVASQQEAAKKAEADAEIARVSENTKQAEALKNEWQANHDGNMELAKRAVTQFFPKEQAADVVSAIESKLGYAATIKLMHAIGKGLGEAPARGLGGEPGAAPVNPGEKLFGEALSKAFPT